MNSKQDFLIDNQLIDLWNILDHKPNLIVCNYINKNKQLLNLKINFLKL